MKRNDTPRKFLEQDVKTGLFIEIAAHSETVWCVTYRQNDYVRLPNGIWLRWEVTGLIQVLQPSCEADELEKLYRVMTTA